MRLRRILELTTNISIIIASLCLAVLLYRQTFPNHETTVSSLLKQGDRFTLPQPQPGKHSTLVLALQVGCHFCEESMPFYKNLTRQADAEGIAVAYILPSKVEDSRKFLQDRGLSDGAVLQENLEKVKVSGTPTLVLLDDGNTVQRVWFGKLDPQREIEVKSALDAVSKRT